MSIELFSDTSNKYLLILVVFALWVLIWVIYWKVNKYVEISRGRTDAVKRSRNAILWELYEKILPFLQNFKYSPKDMVFVGKWFDYLILDGLSEWELREIIFMEVKYWESTLNKNEKMIRQTVGSKKVNYVEFRIQK